MVRTFSRTVVAVSFLAKENATQPPSNLVYLFSVLTGFTTKTPRHEEDTKEIHVLAIHPVSSDQETILEIVMLNEVKNLRAGLGGDSSLLFGRSE